MSHVLQIQMTNQCNLKCEYCYIHQNNDKMSFEMLKQQIKYVEQLSNRIDDDFDGKYDVTYFGGEPLIEYQNILKFDEYLKQSLNIQHSFVQTNGILLDKEKIRQLRKRNIYIGISCDGYNDKNHTYIEKIFQNKWLPVEAKMMINKYNVSDLMKNVVYFYRQAMRVDCGNLYIDVSFVKDNTWDKQSIEILKQQLKNLYDFMIMNYRDYHRWIDVGFVNRICANILNKKRNYICFAGVNGYNLTPNGIIYPCARFYTNHKYPLFDSNSYKFYDENIDIIKHWNRTKNDKCINCVLKQFCNQGCLYSQINNNGIIDMYCDVLKSCYHMVTILYKTMKNEYNVNILKKVGKI